MGTVVSRDVYDALGLLTPYDIDKPKIHVGNDRDGAYIMIEPDQACDVMSFGINDNVTFEREMAERGHRSFMFDHTIDGLPEQNEKFNWKKIGVCSHEGAIDDCFTLKDHIAMIADPTDRMILKIDVEGHEWGVFWQADDETLAHFDQILVEFHWLRFLDQPGFRANFKAALTNINRQFTAHHVHANNCAGMMFVDGFAVADVLEVSYIRTDLVNRRPSRTVYPSPLNRGNRSDRHDYPLLFYPFLPMSVDMDAVAEVIVRIDADRVVV